MKKIVFALLVLLTPLASIACGKDSTNYHPTISYNETYESVAKKISKTYKLHGYCGCLADNLVEEKFNGNTHIAKYEFMGHGFFKYNKVTIKEGWVILIFKNNKLVSLEVKIK